MFMQELLEVLGIQQWADKPTPPRTPKFTPWRVLWPHFLPQGRGGRECLSSALPVGLLNPVLLGPATGLAQSGHPRDVCPVNHWVSTELSTTPHPGYCTGHSAGVLAPIKTEVRSCHSCGTEGKPRSLQWPWKPTISGVLLWLSPHPCLCSKICHLLVLSLTARLPPRTCHRRLPWTQVGTGSTLSPAVGLS